MRQQGEGVDRVGPEARATVYSTSHVSRITDHGLGAQGLRRTRLRRQERERQLNESPPDNPRTRVVPPPPEPKTKPLVEPAPDLLHHTPLLTIDAISLARSLDFAFAGGDVVGALDHVLDTTSPTPSDWNPCSFASDLFLTDLVRSAFKVKLGRWEPVLNEAHLVRVLSHPPRVAEDRDLRRGILEELAGNESARRGIEKVYTSWCRLRRQLDHSETTPRMDLTRRRIDTLASLKEVIEALAAGFDGVQSGLTRLREYGQAVQKTVPYQRLVALLEYEDDLARVDVRLKVGIDGRVRKFELVTVDENAGNRFYQTPIGRIIAKVGLWVRGLRFGNDELVARWLDHVFTAISPILPAMFQLSGDLEVYLATMAFHDRCKDLGLKLCFAEWSDDGGPEIEALFNPLLLSQGITPVPCNLHGDSFETTTIVTGPNSGGKTRLIQALALAQLLAENGLFVPAASARMRRTSGLFVSLVQEASADQREGRLGTELVRIRTLFENARPGALIILDELCSGTNPSEGEEIFVLVLELLRALGSEVFITTHFLEFASKLSSEASPLELRFLQVDLDEAQQPTYGFVPGVASTSLAAQTAARLGVTKDELLALIRRHRN